MGQSRPYISASAKKVPEPDFKSFRTLKELNRYKSLCLFLPVKIVTSQVPWGYTRPATDAQIAIPDQKAIPVFKKALQYIKNHSYQEVSQWMGTCGFPISDDGLKLLIKKRPFWPELELPYEERLKL